MAMKTKTKQRLRAVLICLAALVIGFAAYKLISSGLVSDLIHIGEKNYVVITSDLPKSELEKLEVKVRKVPLIGSEDGEWEYAEFWSENEFYHMILGRGNYRVEAFHPKFGTRSAVLKIDGTSDVYAVNLAFFIFGVTSDVDRSDNHFTAQGAAVPENAYVWNGHAYLVIDRRVDWNEAKAVCETLGGHLATITSEEEHAVVEQVAAASGYEWLWLGGYVEEGTWKWVTGEALEYQHWTDGEPNGEPNGMVMQMMYLTAWDDTWPQGKVEKNAPAQRIVCEWDLAEAQ